MDGGGNGVGAVMPELEGEAEGRVVVTSLAIRLIRSELLFV